MNPPRSRKTTAGATYLDLQATARATGRPVDELFQFYALEGFLRRLTRTSHADNFVLKGGVLLAAYSDRRPTRDVDLAAADRSRSGPSPKSSTGMRTSLKHSGRGGGGAKHSTSPPKPSQSYSTKSSRSPTPSSPISSTALPEPDPGIDVGHVRLHRRQRRHPARAR